MLLLSSRTLPGAFMKLSSQPIHSALLSSRRTFGSHSKPQSKPLRILFCGSDTFSCDSLLSLHQELVHPTRKPPLIQSIDVLVRPPKPTGRGLKTLKPLPISLLAEELSLPIHERDTFRGWDLPPHVNLIIAVSFGLFVPPRILSQAEYGGLNVHPSLLPDLRGPAPIQHAILNNYTGTGVSVQTLSPQAFDHGTVLSQTVAPTFPNHAPPRFDDLRRDLSRAGAGLLLETLKSNLHVPPHVDTSSVGPGIPLIHAPKITRRDQQVDWLVGFPPSGARGQPLSPSARIDLQYRALGALWTHIRTRPSAPSPQSKSKTKSKKLPEYVRLQLGGITAVESFEEARHPTARNDDYGVLDWAQQDDEHGEFRIIPARWVPAVVEGSIVVEIPSFNNLGHGDKRFTAIRINSMKIAGDTEKDAVNVATKLSAGRESMTLVELRTLQATHIFGEPSK
ncbi:Formyltransferase [Cladorrhinum samala]|uniref:methionyl-tRNA formyltransferase n=1 Tax=Cladorrhinum samala TaxID=585594 RepID=A0AAV9HTH6_9PEZI|nr:Formyltransferase [Cladorrhinum samala]